MSYRNTLIVIILSVLPIVAYANDKGQPSLAELWLSKSVGVWEKSNKYGYFKVLVYRTGLEPAGDKVKVIITQADTKKNTQKAIKTIWLDSPGYKGFISDIDLKILKPNKLILGLNVEMKGMDGVEMREVYIIDERGKVKNIVGAQYKDIY